LTRLGEAGPEGDGAGAATPAASPARLPGRRPAGRRAAHLAQQQLAGGKTVRDLVLAQ
jgi:hypothetical protein